MSVDPPEVSDKLVGHLGLGFPVGSDPDGALMKQLGIFDPENEIAWPSLFLIERDRRISWRWLADLYRERPPTADVLAAIDAVRASR